MAPLFEGYSLSWRIGNALISYVAYLGQFFYPCDLAVLHPPLKGDLPMRSICGGFLILLGVTVTVCLARRRRPYLLVGWLWYVGTLLPMIGLVQVGMEARADRFTYLPQIGLCIALTWAAAELFSSRPFRRWACGLVSTAVLAMLMGCAWRQTSFWCDSETLWTHTLACTSRNNVAHNNLGKVLAGRGQLDSAITHFQKALELKPDYAEAHNNLGNALAGRGQVDSAIAHYQKALELKPDYATAHYNLALTLAGRGQVDSAIAHYQKALEIKPDYAEAHNNFGAALAGHGQVDLAIAHYQKALEIKPDYADAHNNLAVARSERERILKTLAERREAMRLQPNDAALLNNTAWMLATNPNASVRNGAEAVELAERALKLSGGNEPAILGTLAAAQAEAGRFPEAAATARKALELARQQNNQALADVLRARIALYEAGKPYHEASLISASDGKADRGTVIPNAGKRQPMVRPAKEPSKNIPPSAKAPRR